VKPATHEDFSRKEAIRGGSDRSFGLIFALFFTVVSTLPLLTGKAVRLWALAVVGAFLCLGLILPALLHPLNWLWTRFAWLIGKVTNPILMGLMFYLIFTPAALVRRLLARDALRLKFEGEAGSYWIPRNPPGPAPESIRNQF